MNAICFEILNPSFKTEISVGQSSEPYYMR
jgi:hypothetical protein